MAPHLSDYVLPNFLFCWGYLKHNVYQKNPRRIAEMQVTIITKIMKISTYSRYHLEYIFKLTILIQNRLLVQELKISPGKCLIAFKYKTYLLKRKFNIFLRSLFRNVFFRRFQLSKHWNCECISFISSSQLDTICSNFGCTDHDSTDFYFQCILI